MLDKSLDRFLLALEKEDGDVYPRYELPKGYTAHMWEPDRGYEEAFARMEVACGQYGDFNSALKTFNSQFIHNTTFPDLDPRERCLFIKAPTGEIMATCSMWMGTDLCATPRPRMHWLIVGGGHEGKGIARALVTKMLDLHAKVDSEKYLYLNTTTWSMHAINIYLQFGFKPYYGKKPLSKCFEEMSEEEWAKQNEYYWNAVNERIAFYNAKKAHA